MEAVSADFDGKAKFVKVEVDKEGEVLERFDAASIPRYLLYKDGKKVDELWAGIDWWFEWRLSRMVRGALE